MGNRILPLLSALADTNVSLRPEPLRITMWLQQLQAHMLHFHIQAENEGCFQNFFQKSKEASFSKAQGKFLSNFTDLNSKKCLLQISHYGQVISSCYFRLEFHTLFLETGWSEISPIHIGLEVPRQHCPIAYFQKAQTYGFLFWNCVLHYSHTIQWEECSMELFSRWPWTWKVVLRVVTTKGVSDISQIITKSTLPCDFESIFSSFLWNFSC